MMRLHDFLFAWLGLSSVSQAQEPAPRKDLVMALGQLFCKGDITPQKLWAEGIYEGQIEGQKIESPSFVNLNETELWGQAKSLADLRHGGGYAAGLCSQHMGWTAAMPGSSPLRLKNNQSIDLPKSDLKERCRSWTLYFSASEGGLSKVLATTDLGDSVAKVPGAGVMSLHCRPKFPRWAGEQVWSFYPTMELKDYGDFPEKARIKDLSLTAGDVQLELLKWIAAIRVREKLAPFVLSPVLSEAASELLVSDSIDHDLHHMEQIRKKLGRSQAQLEGENRVRGKTLEEIAWLLWNSPRHRDLLLTGSSAKASQADEVPVIGLATKKIGAESLISMVVGYEKKSPISQKSGRKSRKNEI
jgi:hypothetical protein